VADTRGHPSRVEGAGADNGGFGSALRRFGCTGDVLSFEPVGAAYAALAEAIASPR
jgi:hypothetical protein